MSINRLGGLSRRLGGRATHPSVIGSRGFNRSVGQSPDMTPTGLTFPSNGAANSDIRLVWSGGNLLPRLTHTAVWKARYVQQDGYYATAWHSHNTGSWPADLYMFGTHPYPTTGSVNSAGSSTGGTGGTGEVHYYEIAGLGANDYIASPGPGPTLVVTKDAWVTQARTCALVSGTTYRHAFYPDIVGNPSMAIVHDIDLASMSSPGAPAFYFGASDWTNSGNINSETPSCTLRGLMLFNAGLSLADIATEAANETSNAAVTTAGIASVWYCNKSPTPTDVADKQIQRAAHSPSWANANRPTLYEG